MGYTEPIEVIKVHFRNGFRGADENLATVDRIWQVSDTNSSQIIKNSSDKLVLHSGTPLKLGEEYELDIESIDFDGERVYLVLSKNGNVIDFAMVKPPQAADDTFINSKYTDSAEPVEVIRVHFRNVFRGVDQNLATVDKIWQVSDSDPSLVIINNSHKMDITSSTPLKLGEGYELAIRSTDFDGNSAYVELSKNGMIIDSALIILPNKVEDTYAYTKDLAHSEGVEVVKVHFKNAFRGENEILATVDRIWQVSETNTSLMITNRSDRLILTMGTPLKLGEGYELAIKSIDIDGNKVYVELSKNETVIDSALIIPPNEVEDIYTYTKDLDHSGTINVHFKNAFRGADQNFATVDRIWQVSGSDPSQEIKKSSDRLILTMGTPLKLEEGYELAIKSIDIDGNKVYVELSKERKGCRLCRDHNLPESGRHLYFRERYRSCQKCRSNKGSFQKCFSGKR